MTSTPLNREGQPAASINWHRNLVKNLVKSTSALLGLCTGFIAVRVLTNDEIALLDTWLADNADVAASWPGDAIAGRLREILADGIVTEGERADLFDTLSRLVGGTLEEHGAASGMATRFGIGEPASIEINGRVFCFSGKFIYGPRARRRAPREGHGPGSRRADGRQGHRGGVRQAGLLRADPGQCAAPGPDAVRHRYPAGRCGLSLVVSVMAWHFKRFTNKQESADREAYAAAEESTRPNAADCGKRRTRSRRGTGGCKLYSPIRTKANGLDYYAYLRHVFTLLPHPFCQRA